MLPRGQAVKLWFISPLHLSNASVLPGKTGKQENHNFSVNCCINCFARVRPIVAWFLQVCWLATYIDAAVNSLNLIINWLQLWPVGGTAQEKWSWEFLRNKLLICIVHTMRWCMHELCCWNADNMSLTTCLITVNICWDGAISHQYCPFTFHLRLNKEQLPLLTQRPTSRQTLQTMSVWHQMVACYTPFLCFVWCIQLILVRMKSSSAVTKW